MDNFAIRELLDATFKGNPIVKLEQLPSEEVKQLLLKINRIKVEPDNPSDIINDENCFLCESNLDSVDLKKYVLDLDILLEYFRFDRNLFQASKYCSECYSALKKIEAKYSAMRKLRQELDSMVSCVKAVLRLKIINEESLSSESEVNNISPRRPEQDDEKCENDALSNNILRDVSEPGIPIAVEVDQEESILANDCFETSTVNDFDPNELDPMAALLLDIKIEEDTDIADPPGEKAEENHVDNIEFDESQFMTQPQAHHSAITVTCPYCGQVLESIRRFDQHFKLSHPGMSLQCEHCDQVYSSIVNLRMHELSAHAQKNNANCLSSNENFVFLCPFELQKVYRHQQVDHDRLKSTVGLKSPRNVPFRCNVCGKGFYKETVFRQHIHHGKEIFYKCSKCPFESRFWGNVTTHEKNKHNLGYGKNVKSHAKNWQAGCSTLGTALNIRDQQQLNENESRIASTREDEWFGT